MIYVICCNDSLKFGVVNDQEKAERIMEEFKKDQQKQSSLRNDYENYYWHIHEIDGE